MISTDFTFIMNMFLFSDQRGGIESVHPESNRVWQKLIMVTLNGWIGEFALYT